MTQNQSPSLESLLRRLEAIADELETGNISLDDALTRFTDGVETVRAAERLLDEADARIVQLLESSDGVEVATLDVEE